ncbi:M23 family metallopeptidase [Amphiplicatus metriothermophilus]|uniref:Murein DD-endopeptidase MepM and murein hydrolase activator NlpD, contain LysM domain n=1 Tax=Amphiplicatus metriothermophilus TaxID=1519374 RepID=A0A239PSN2_9PROT|nr:M23 family metallopeptidase [Amphiplicatus metriothermophilus]MBB5519100.1 murein DD-endopeptidase MepM/ murein hydrolase activator NlpD [Amphiplicatus metriothermophilus]SNT73170.1 Murein DD-endopeptidase MepM and murein hydrolase activator NlpD, contain LysM domain [Amphiplicatus metriothermophilus]
MTFLGWIAAGLAAAGAAPPAAPGLPIAPPAPRAPAAAPILAPPRHAGAQDALALQARYAEAMQRVAERQRVFPKSSDAAVLSGRAAQGGLVFGRTVPGATARLDGETVMVDEDGRFLLGFGRDSAPTALLVVTLPDGAVERIAIEVEDRDFPVQRIDGLDQSKVSGFTEAQLEKIAADKAKKDAARLETHARADWADGFAWPVEGPISGVFGSQRILNGEPKRPHSGLDIAAPEGTPVRAPAAGIVRLAESGMYFEGGLVFLDHGHWLESAFMHLSRIDVAPGQRVEKGDVIGAVGATGRATGPHLHWSLKWTDRLVDPQLVLPPPADKAAAAAE